jgi:hypothetical protein
LLHNTSVTFKVLRGFSVSGAGEPMSRGFLRIALLMQIANLIDNLHARRRVPPFP